MVSVILWVRGTPHSPPSGDRRRDRTRPPTCGVVFGYQPRRGTAAERASVHLVGGGGGVAASERRFDRVQGRSDISPHGAPHSMLEPLCSRRKLPRGLGQRPMTFYSNEIHPGVAENAHTPGRVHAKMRKIRQI